MKITKTVASARERCSGATMALFAGAFTSTWGEEQVRGRIGHYGTMDAKGEHLSEDLSGSVRHDRRSPAHDRIQAFDDLS
jgi:hypothetical protein